MENVPDLKLGIIAVSRDCFPIELSRKRLHNVVQSFQKFKSDLSVLETIIENENDVNKALNEISEKRINSLVVYLGNFGPEGPLSILVQKFDGPSMVLAAAEESGKDLINGRGDAYCGLLSASYNFGLRNLSPHIPENPVCLPDEAAEYINSFIPIARTYIGLKNLKIFSFGPRPFDFLTCHAPIKPLFNIGVEIMENSELDLYDLYLSAENDPDIKSIAADMAEELGTGNTYPELLENLAQYEVALTKFMKENLGTSKYGVFANKCWPGFEKFFKFVPCFVNSRLASRGIPVACESDIYGALSEYIVTCSTELPAAILDINNTVPHDLLEGHEDIAKDYQSTDLFMGFHCGNTASGCMINPEIKYQLIMHRVMEPGQEPDITRGTLEGRFKPGGMTIFRLQSTAEAELKAYVAEGEILDLDPKSFGCIGIFGIKEMGRFYRHVLIEKKFPHHTAVAFNRSGRILHDIVKLIGVDDISFNHPKEILYKSEIRFQD